MTTEHTTTTPEDATTAATASRMNPRAVYEAVEDPTVFAPFFRGLGMVNAQKLAELMKNPNIPIRDRMAWQEMCLKYGGVQAPQAQVSALDGVPRIQIFLHDTKTPTVCAGPVIDIQPEALPAPGTPTDD